jgi:hypothetical protein
VPQLYEPTPQGGLSWLAVLTSRWARPVPRLTHTAADRSSRDEA